MSIEDSRERFDPLRPADLGGPQVRRCTGLTLLAPAEADVQLNLSVPKIGG